MLLLPPNETAEADRLLRDTLEAPGGWRPPSRSRLVRPTAVDGLSEPGACEVYDFWVGAPVEVPSIIAACG